MITRRPHTHALPLLRRLACGLVPWCVGLRCLAADPAPPGAAPNPADAVHQALDLDQFTNQAASHYVLSGRPPVQTDIFFFPPDPPALGGDLRLLRPMAFGIPAPAEMRAFVNEPFYSILSVRLAAGDLPKRLQNSLDAYRAAKLELENELRQRLARLKTSEPAARDGELAELAREQSARLAALESTAFQLRADLQRGGLYGWIAGRGDWNDYRTWRLPPKPGALPAPDDRRREFEVLRAAVGFQEGLSPPQRRLLREVVIELQADLHPAEGAAPAAAAPDLISFLPETARLRLPAKLPSDLAGRVAAFRAAKSELKAELRAAVRQGDDLGEPARSQALAQLAVRQAPRIAALESLAEEIRRGLADLPDLPGPPAPPALPADLAARISTYRTHRFELLKELNTILTAPEAAGRPARAGQIKEQVDAFNRDNAARFAELKREKDRIRDALAHYVQSLGGARDQKSIDDLLEEFENARQKQEIWERYRDYQAAVLLPGLSPAQRRLLYDAAIEELELPLPAGEAPH